MPSSTSSSDARLPGGPWGKTWLLAALLTVGMAAAGERLGRARGFVPSVTDDLDLWCVQRDTVARRPRATIALVGTSRMENGVVPAVLRRALPGHPIAQLAVAGRYPLATLRDLADDPAFAGTVLCELTPYALVPEREDDQGPHVRHYQTAWNPKRRIERELESLVQERLVLFREQFRLGPIARALRHRRWEFVDRGPVVRSSPCRRDRSRELDFRGFAMQNRQTVSADVAAGVATQNERALNMIINGNFDPVYKKLQGQVGRIAARGGKVVLVRFPISGPARAVDDRDQVGRVFWAGLARRTGAYVIDFEAVPSLAEFECPDGTHLDGRDAARYTRALSAELQRRGIVTAGARPGATWIRSE